MERVTKEHVEEWVENLVRASRQAGDRDSREVEVARHQVLGLLERSRKALGEVRKELTDAVHGPLLRDGKNRDEGGLDFYPDPDHIYGCVWRAYHAIKRPVLPEADWRERAARALCRQQDDDPDAPGESDNHQYRWQDYLEMVKVVEREHQGTRA
ncbi:hypothetical protein TK90_2620 (plasmid) [Thioalkalivibrio sp. K90mix]|uniref:hypothetical protein n=1 Tax=Thioalkalivibrio sp. (strain K90mix) TaxID=396595 RepID=UPI000195AB26|nr:hypothetical protein [Thioalkalivibrio sp. K90mix]ADC73107.1 hypothetical protein TK90_2620 [Thioalkalivibrio sp. K90mix]